MYSTYMINKQTTNQKSFSKATFNFQKPDSELIFVVRSFLAHSFRIILQIFKKNLLIQHFELYIKKMKFTGKKKRFIHEKMGVYSVRCR